MHSSCQSSGSSGGAPVDELLSALVGSSVDEDPLGSVLELVLVPGSTVVGPPLLEPPDVVPRDMSGEDMSSPHASASRGRQRMSRSGVWPSTVNLNPSYAQRFPRAVETLRAA